MNHVNVIPLDIKVGFYVEVKDFNNDGVTSAIKIKVGYDYSYYQSANMSNLKDSKRSFKGSWDISLDQLTLSGFINGKTTTFNIDNFGKDLYLNGELVYVFAEYNY